MHLGIALIICWGAARAAMSLAHAETPLQGRWLTQERTSIVEIYQCAPDMLCGRLLWLRIRPTDPNQEAVDDRNPRAELRRRKLCGLVMMWGFKQTAEDEWGDGTLYDPESGNFYSGKLTLRSDGTMSLRGYIGISLIGRSQIWTRFTDPIPPCPGTSRIP